MNVEGAEMQLMERRIGAVPPFVAQTGRAQASVNEAVVRPAVFHRPPRALKLRSTLDSGGGEFLRFHARNFRAQRGEIRREALRANTTLRGCFQRNATRQGEKDE